MIEINLIPDVKQEFIRAKRTRTLVISGAVLVGVGSVAFVVLLAVYLFGVQTVRSGLISNDITAKSNQLKGIDDIDNTLTVQHQLTRLDELHNQKNLVSRLFNLLIAINPAPPDEVIFSKTTVDAETGTVTLEGQTSGRYNTADVLKKTILGTKISYTDSDDETQTESLTDDVLTSNLSFGEDSSGKKVLSFAMTFEYNPEFFARGSKNAIVIKPNRQNVTDSYVRLPDSLFGTRSTNVDEGGA